ncbi:MAG: hypothetical protein HYR85_16005 [Planctomycetes bacterium]|nr:hypothetical protein [Planctomycetota bacterium]MBI3846227.1 hypothetical protein [Planctomycetota bacterium]
MFDRFTDRARKVMGLARQEAQRWNHEYIGTEHILLGVLKLDSGGAVDVLDRLRVDRSLLVAETRRRMKTGPNMVTMGQLPFTPRGKTVLELSLDEASILGHNYIGSEHILLGLIRCAGIAGEVFKEANVTIDAARAAVSRDPGAPSEDVVPTPHGRYQIAPTVTATPRSRPERASHRESTTITAADRGLRLSMRVGAIYDVVLAIVMLTALPLLSRLLAIPMPADPLFVRFNALLLVGVALFYWLGASAPSCLRFAAGTIAFRAGGGIFVALQVPLAHAPLAFLLVGAADLAFATWTWAELRFRVHVRFWPLLLSGDVRELP